MLTLQETEAIWRMIIMGVPPSGCSCFSFSLTRFDPEDGNSFFLNIKYSIIHDFKGFFARLFQGKLINKCPGGHIPEHAGVSGGQTEAHFPHEACANCELREQCFSKKQVKDCVVRINLKAVNAGREREKIKSSKKENTSKRAGIEGTNSALKRGGLDKLNVRGKAKSTVVCGLKVTVQNIKRFIKYLQGGYKTKHDNQPPNGIPVPILS